MTHQSVDIRLKFTMDKGIVGSSDSSLVEGETRGRKLVSSSPGRSGRRNFFTRVDFMC